MAPVGIWRNVSLDALVGAKTTALSAEVVLSRSAPPPPTTLWPPQQPAEPNDTFVITVRAVVLCASHQAALVVQAALPALNIASAPVSVACDDAARSNGSNPVTLVLRVRVGDAAAWFPVGYGAQPLYTLAVTTAASDGSGTVFSNSTRRIGLREARLVRQPLPNGENGTSFVFQVLVLGIVAADRENGRAAKHKGSKPAHISFRNAQ